MAQHVEKMQEEHQANETMLAKVNHLFQAGILSHDEQNNVIVRQVGVIEEEGQIQPGKASRSARNKQRVQQ